MSDIKGLREISNDPFGKLLTSLSKKFSAFLAKDQAELVENPEDIYADGQDVESALKYHNFTMRKQFSASSPVQYMSAREPDADNVRLMLGPVWVNLGTELTDKSTFDNHATIHGDPILVDGAPLDLGVVDSVSDCRSVAIRFNRPTSDLAGGEDMYVLETSDLNVSGLSTGISYFIRLKIYDLSQQGESPTDRRIFEKIDDNTPNDGVQLKVTTGGRLVFQITHGGSTFAWQTPSNTIVVGTVYDIWCSYAVSGNVMHVYVNNVDQTLTTTSTQSWHSNTADHDLAIFYRGGTSTNGYLYGDFYSMMVLREDVVSASDVNNFYTNKLTTANIPFGQVAISNYSATYTLVVSTGSFTSTSFTSTSFTT